MPYIIVYVFMVSPSSYRAHCRSVASPHGSGHKNGDLRRWKGAEDEKGDVMRALHIWLMRLSAHIDQNIALYEIKLIGCEISCFI